MGRGCENPCTFWCIVWLAFGKSQVIKYSGKASHKHCCRWESQLSFALFQQHCGHHPWWPAGTAPARDVVGLPLPILVIAVGEIISQGNNQNIFRENWYSINFLLNKNRALANSNNNNNNKILCLSTSFQLLKLSLEVVIIIDSLASYSYLI